jgi:hypothetical protein
VARPQRPTVPDDVPRHLVRAILLASGLLLAGCGSSTPAADVSGPTTELTAPGSEDEDVETPIQNAALEPGVRYAAEDLLPDLTVEMTGPDAALYYGSYPGVIALSSDANFRTDSLYLTDVDRLMVPVDPYLSLGAIATDADLVRVTSDPPEDLLDYAATRPMVDVLVPERSLTVAGVEGRAVDLRVRDLPPEAAVCGQGSGVGIPVCAVMIMAPGLAPLMQPGQDLRVIDLELPAGHLLLYQNLDVPQSQAVVDSLAFDDR